MDDYKKEKAKLDATIREQCKNIGWNHNALSYYLKAWDKLLIPKESTQHEYEYYKTSCEEYTRFLIDIKNEVNNIILMRFKTDIGFNSREDITEFHLSKFIKDKYPNNKFNMLSKIKSNYYQKMQVIERFKKVFRNINKSIVDKRKYYKQQKQNIRTLKKQLSDCEDHIIKICPGGRIEFNKFYIIKAKCLQKQIKFLEDRG